MRAIGVNDPFRGEAGADSSAAGAEYLDALTGHPAVRVYKELTFDLALRDAPDAVLDVGCGVGEDARAIAERADAARVVGVDINPDFVEEAARRAQAAGAGVEFRLAEPSAPLPFSDNEFGAVRADRVLQHVEDPGGLIGEICRVAAPGARIVLSEPDWGALAVSGLPAEQQQAVAGLMTSAFASPRIGRELGGELERRDLREIDEQRDSLVITSLAEAQMLLSLDALVQQAGGEQADAIMTALSELDAAGELAVEMVGYIVTGRLAGGAQQD